MATDINENVAGSAYSATELQEVPVSTTAPADGEVLTYNSSSGEWEPAAGGGSPGGDDTYVQFNDGGVFGGEAAFNYNKTTDVLTVGGPGLGKISISGTENTGKLYIQNGGGGEDTLPAISLRNGLDPINFGFDIHHYTESFDGDLIISRVSGAVDNPVIRIKRDSAVTEFEGTVKLNDHGPGLLHADADGNISAVSAPQFLTTQEDIQEITFDLVPDAGSIDVNWHSGTPATLNWDDSTATIETQLKTIHGELANISVSGDFSTSIVVTFYGVTWASTDPFPALTISNNTLESSTNPVTPTVTETQAALCHFELDAADAGRLFTYATNQVNVSVLLPSAAEVPGSIFYFRETGGGSFLLILAGGLGITASTNQTLAMISTGSSWIQLFKVTN